MVKIMPRKFRLSIQRKNEFSGKKNAVTSTSTMHGVSSITVEPDPTSISHESSDHELLHNVQDVSLHVSIPLEIYLDAIAPSISILRQRIQALLVLPEGII